MTDDMEMDFEALLDESESRKAGVSPGQRVEGTVVSVGAEYVYLDLGARQEGLLERYEVVDEDGEPTVAEGDRLTVLVTGVREGALMCALRLGAGGAAKSDGKTEALQAIREAFDAEMPVEGTVKEVVKGGFGVSVLGARAFCPISQIDNKYCENGEEHVGRSYPFVILKYEESGRNVVLSRRVLLEREAEELAAARWDTLREGEVVEGTVASLKPYGAFVDIGGLQGLLHVSEISHARVVDPGEVLAVGQRLEVQIKETDRDAGRVGLSLKALLDDPWDEVAARLGSGQIVSGVVTRIARFGAFVQLEDGIEGLVHISEMSRERRINTPREVVSEGDQVQVRILEVDAGERRISLTLDTDNVEERWAEELAKSPSAKSEPSSGGGMGTLGDLLAAQLTKK